MSKKIVLDLYDVSIQESDWKVFRKGATQEELAVLAIGSKYRLEAGRWKSLIFTIGIVLSIVIGIATFTADIGPVILIVGYLFFSFLATKTIRYSDTYDKCYGKLKSEARKEVKSYFHTPVGIVILDFFIQFVIGWITIPYQAIMMLIGLFAPNFVISKNGVLVSIPKGYDVGGLEAIGAYYASFKVTDEINHTMEENTRRSHPTRMVCENGSERTLEYYDYDAFNGRDRYRDDTGRFWYTDDGGSSFYRE